MHFHCNSTAHICSECQKWEGDCGLWVLNEMIKRIFPENLKKIVGAVWEFPPNNTANLAQFEWKWAGLAVLFSR